MEKLIKPLLSVFAIFWAYRLLSNVSKFLRIVHYQNQYTEFIEKQNFNYAQYTETVIQLFKAAGVQDRAIPFTQPSGYGYLAQGNASLFLNINNLREDTVQLMLQCFSEARGTYRHRIIENFSPIFWINSVIFLPRTILEYLGVKGDSILVKLFQLLYWIASPTLLIFRDKILEHIDSLFS